jgi:hypothetical protein
MEMQQQASGDTKVLKRLEGARLPLRARVREGLGELLENADAVGGCPRRGQKGDLKEPSGSAAAWRHAKNASDGRCLIPAKAFARIGFATLSAARQLHEGGAV